MLTHSQQPSEWCLDPVMNLILCYSLKSFLHILVSTVLWIWVTSKKVEQTKQIKSSHFKLVGWFTSDDKVDFYVSFPTLYHTQIDISVLRSITRLNRYTTAQRVVLSVCKKQTDVSRNHSDDSLRTEWSHGVSRCYWKRSSDGWKKFEVRLTVLLYCCFQKHPESPEVDLIPFDLNHDHKIKAKMKDLLMLSFSPDTHACVKMHFKWEMGDEALRNHKNKMIN